MLGATVTNKASAGSKPADVLLLGAAGRVGQFTAAALVQRGLSVRALVRDAERAGPVLPKGVDLVQGDLLKVDSVLPDLVQGVGAIIFTAGGAGAAGSNPRAVDYEAVGAIARAARAAGVRHMILVSSAAVTQAEHPHNCTFDSVLKWKWRGEEALRQSGLAYTVMRPLGLRDREGGQRGIRIVQGDRIAFGEDIARADVGMLLADIAALALGRPEPARSRVKGLTRGAVLNQTFEVFNDDSVEAG